MTKRLTVQEVIQLANHPEYMVGSLDLKKGALHEDLGIPVDKKIPVSRLKKAEKSRNPKIRKRAQMADNMRHWHHAGLEVAAKPLANVYVGQKIVGEVISLRGKFWFQPAWDAVESVPARFSAPTAEELKVQLAERGLRAESASTMPELTLNNPSTLLEQTPEIDAEHPATMSYAKEHDLIDDRFKPAADKHNAGLPSEYLKERNFPKPMHIKSQASLEIAAGKPGGIRAHLEKTGWKQNGKIWVHPTSKNQLIHTDSKTHLHHYSVTHKNGEVSRHKTNSDNVLKRHISKLAKKADTSGISNTLKSNSGSLHAYFGKPHGEKLSQNELEKLSKSDHPLAGRARLVFNLNKARNRGPITYKAKE